MNKLPMKKRDASMNSDLAIGDLETVLEVAHSGSVRGTSRRRGVTPSQVSKAIARVEGHLGAALFVRSARGLRLTDVGRRVTPHFVEIDSQMRDLRATAGEAELTLVATAYLTAFLIPAIADALPGVRLHSLEMQPGLPSGLAGLPLFDIVLTTGGERWPASWSPLEVGYVRHSLYASPRLALQLGTRPTVERLREGTFIGPVYCEGGRTTSGDDLCPLPPRERRFGHRTQTVAVALELAAQVDQLVFAPAVAARRYVERGELVEIPVERWSVREPLHLICHQERVQAPVQRTIAAAIRRALHTLEAASRKRTPGSDPTS